MPGGRWAQCGRCRAQVRHGGDRDRDPDRLLRNDAGEAGLPLSLTKPLGVGTLNNRHKQTGEVFPEAVATMVQLNAEASRAALDAGARCATDVTGFGLLGHLYKLARASNLTAVVDAAAVALPRRRPRVGCRWVRQWRNAPEPRLGRPHLRAGPGVDENEQILLADARRRAADCSSLARYRGLR